MKEGSIPLKEIDPSRTLRERIVKLCERNPSMSAPAWLNYHRFITDQSFYGQFLDELERLEKGAFNFASAGRTPDVLYNLFATGCTIGYVQGIRRGQNNLLKRLKEQANKI